MKRVCIIGAGASGLAAIRHVSRTPGFEGIVFEQSNGVGGVWDYSEETRETEGAIYKSLITHLPKELMWYPDFPGTRATTGSFLRHEEMLQYLKDYSDFFNLSQFIKLRHEVVKVTPKTEGSTTQWDVTVLDLASKEVFTETFDAVMVCNGHNSKPYFSSLENRESFTGDIIHSKEYRKPDVDIFIRKKVLIIGSGLSALDLSFEIAPHANEVILSHNLTPSTFHQSWFSSNLKQLGVVKQISGNRVVFQGAEIGNDVVEEDVDTVVFCTGYEFDFPFLNLENVNMQIVEGKRVLPLWRHFIHAKHPSICFIGITILNPVIKFFDCQVRFFVKFLEGLVPLPTESEMRSDIERDFKIRTKDGENINRSHSMQVDPWTDYQILGDEAGFDTSWIPLMRSIYNQAIARRNQFPRTYKNDIVRVLSDNKYEYEYLECHEEIEEVES